MNKSSNQNPTYQEETLLDAAGIGRTLTRLAHEIVEFNSGIENLVLIGIQTRGTTLADRIGTAIGNFEGVTPQIGYLDVTMHRDDFDRDGLRGTPLPTELPSIESKTVVLIDDVLYTGRTVRAAMDALNDYGRPRQIRLAVLIDRGHREFPIAADYVGKNIPTSNKEIVRVQLVEDRDADSASIYEVD